MIDENLLSDAISIILDRILTPVLYMYEDEVLEFICFPDSNISDKEIADTEAALFTNLGIFAEIVDIRTFDENDRVEITETAQLLYTENDFVKMMFETAMQVDRERVNLSKRTSIQRMEETGTYYIN